MARATRSSAALVEQANRKRKRNSSPHEKPQKLIRTDDPSSSVADASLSDSEARKILDILETSDSLGLLDRVFPLAPSSSPDQTFSLRTLLLAEPQQHSLRVLRAAIQHLYPLSSHPRSKHSETASQQLRFCALALSLLDQASRTLLSLPLNAPSLLPQDSPDASPTDEPKAASSPPSPSTAKRRYALVQHLPSGDYWSSLDSERATSPLPLHRDLPIAFAELVSVLPTSSSLSSESAPTLASYCLTKSHTSKKALPAQRRVTVGAFLDYGPWTSFAPSFDHEGETVGRRELAEALWYRHERKSHREAELREWIGGRGSIVDVPEQVQIRRSPVDLEADFDGILPPETIQNLKAALDNAELEQLVDELLTRNQRALVRLQELQIGRLTKEGAGSTTVDETSEEWEIAHGIMESLQTLTSLRPRAASGQNISIVPPVSILRKLHTTLALEPRPGWHGTLVSARTTALRDDSTVKVRASSTVPTTVSTSSSPAPTPAVSTATATTTPYAGYAYAYSAQQQAQAAYRPAAAATGTTAYAQYKPGAYYQNYAPGTQQQTQQPQYYGQQAYGAGATGQQPYAAYSSWFAHAQYSQVGGGTAAGGTASTGRGTPQPVTAYGAFYAQQAQQQRSGSAAGTTTPAVANTVALNKVGTGTGAATGAWVGYGGQQQASVPTLPAHLRPPQAIANGYQTQQQQQQSYYGGYQAPQQAGR